MGFLKGNAIASDDIVTACPLCACDKPSRSIRLLRNVVKRRGRYVSVISGEELMCVECGGEWAYSYLGGVFSKRPRMQPAVPSNATSTHEFSAPPKTTVTAWTPRVRSAGV